MIVKKAKEADKEEIKIIINVDDNKFTIIKTPKYSLDEKNKRKLIGTDWLCEDFANGKGLFVFDGIAKNQEEFELILREILKISPKASVGYYELDCSLGQAIKSKPNLGIFKKGNYSTAYNCLYVVRW